MKDKKNTEHTEYLEQRSRNQNKIRNLTSSLQTKELMRKAASGIFRGLRRFLKIVVQVRK